MRQRALLIPTLGVATSVLLSSIFLPGVAVASEPSAETQLDQVTAEAVANHYDEPNADPQLEDNNVQVSLEPAGGSGQPFTVSAEIPE